LASVRSPDDAHFPSHAIQTRAFTNPVFSNFGFMDLLSAISTFTSPEVLLAILTLLFFKK